MELISKKIKLPMNIRKRIDNMTKNNKVRIIEDSVVEIKGTNISFLNPIVGKIDFLDDKKL